MGLDRESKQEFWCYNHDKKWKKIESPLVTSFEDTEEFLEKQGFLLEPDIVLGDEFNFVALFEHPSKEKYLFHLEIDSFAKFIYADSLPGMFYVLEQLNYIINGHFRTLKLLESLQDED